MPENNANITREIRVQLEREGYRNIRPFDFKQHPGLEQTMADLARKYDLPPQNRLYLADHREAGLHYIPGGRMVVSDKLLEVGLKPNELANLLESCFYGGHVEELWDKRNQKQKKAIINGTAISWLVFKLLDDDAQKQEAKNTSCKTDREQKNSSRREWIIRNFIIGFMSLEGGLVNCEITAGDKFNPPDYTVDRDVLLETLSKIEAWNMKQEMAHEKKAQVR